MPTPPEDTSRRSQRGKGAPVMIVPRVMAASAILLALACPAAAQDAPPAEPGAQHQAAPVPAAPPAPQAGADAERLLQLDLRAIVREELGAAQRLAELERRNLILEAREELRDDDLTILQIILGVLGTLLTFLVGGFAYFSYRNAKQEVAHAIREAKDLVDSSTKSISEEMAGKLREMESLLGQAQASVATIRSIKDASEQMKRQQATALMDAVTSGGKQPTPEEKQEVADSAEAIRQKPRGTLSVDELLILIGDNMAQKRYEQVIEDATLLRALHPDDEVAVAQSWITQGYAFSQLESHAEALRVYEHLLRRFANNDRPALQKQVAQALVNKGLTLGLMQRHEEELAAYDELLRRFADSDRPELQEPVARALFSKGLALGEMGRPIEANAAHDELLHRLADSDRPEIKKWVAKALYYKASMLARQNKTAEATAVLEQWVAKAGKVDCELIAKDSDFDPIRDDPGFQDFLRRHGCIAEA